MPEKISVGERLENAYFALLESTPYNKIVVSDILSIAGVSRTTFYRHYDDIFDMHKKITEKLSRDLMKNVFLKVISLDDKSDCYSELLQVFHTYEKQISLLTGENGSRHLFEYMFSSVSKGISLVFPELNEEQLFRIRFMTLAIIGIYIQHIIENREHKPKNIEYIELCKKLVNTKDLTEVDYGK